MASFRDDDGALGNFDFTAIEEMDPSVADGYRVIYDRECPLELRLQESQASCGLARFTAATRFQRRRTTPERSVKAAVCCRSAEPHSWSSAATIAPASQNLADVAAVKSPPP